MAHLQQTVFTMEKRVWYSPNKFEAYGEAEIQAVVEALREGWLAGFGPRTQKFEEEIAKRFNKKWGLFVNSGSSANMLAVAGLDLPEGCEIVTPAATFSTTVAPIVQLGYTPVFCEVLLDGYVPSIDMVMEKVNEKTKAIMVPNLLGNIMDFKGLKQRLKEIGREDIFLIEDSADTINNCVDSDVATTSFYASHLITAGGSGGMVMFNDENQLRRASMFRDWGRIGNNSENMDDRFKEAVDGIPYDFKFLYGCQGYNFKSSEMNAAFGLTQLARFDGFAAKRRSCVERYKELLKGSSCLLPDDSIQPNWLAMPLQIENGKRGSLLRYLESQGIQTRVCMAGNVTRHPAYRKWLEPFENCDKIMANAFLLGAHHGMEPEDVDYACSKIFEWEIQEGIRQEMPTGLNLQPPRPPKKLQ